MTEPERILVSVPNWVGDVVMATASLRALRRRFTQARIVLLMRPYVADVLAGTGFGDVNIFWPSDNPGPKGTRGNIGLIRQLRRERFDLAVLLTNSFRSALVARLGGARRRVGYDRDGRGWLLSDKLAPKREQGRFVPDPALDYYNRLVRFLDCDDPGDRLELATSPADESAIDARLGATPDDRPLVVLNPGANYGSAKCWPAQKFAEVADALVDRHNARVVASLGPKERRIADALKAGVRREIDVFVDPPLGLGPLKALIRRSRLLITNDTGPRHFAAAFNVPVVTVFGSSDPAWTITRFAKERSVTLDLDCQPCMERTCPLEHHRCMRDLAPEMVLQMAEELLSSTAATSGTVDQPCS